MDVNAAVEAKLRVKGKLGSHPLSIMYTKHNLNSLLKIIKIYQIC